MHRPFSGLLSHWPMQGPTALFSWPLEELPRALDVSSLRLPAGGTFCLPSLHMLEVLL